MVVCKMVLHPAMRGILLFISLCVARSAGATGCDIGLPSQTAARLQRESSPASRLSATPRSVPQQALLAAQEARGGSRSTDILILAGDEELGAGLRPRASYHVARKTFHFSTIMAFAILYSAKLPQKDFARGMVALDACVLVGELARLRIVVINKALLWVFGAFMRAHELKKFSGIMYCLAGLGITSVLFPKHIALLGMLQLALGDPVAALFGHATRSVGWSRVRSGKGVLGALGCATALTVANSVVLAKSTFDGETPPLGRIVLAAGMIATWTAVVELSVPSPQKTLPCDAFPLALDDNAAIPVFGALGAAAVFHFLALGSCELPPMLFA